MATTLSRFRLLAYTTRRALEISTTGCANRHLSKTSDYCKDNKDSKGGADIEKQDTLTNIKEAASEAAAVFKGSQDETYTDLVSQLNKLHNLTANRSSAFQQKQTKTNSPGAAKSRPIADNAAQHERMVKIKARYVNNTQKDVKESKPKDPHLEQKETGKTLTGNVKKAERRQSLLEEMMSDKTKYLADQKAEIKIQSDSNVRRAPSLEKSNNKAGNQERAAHDSTDSKIIPATGSELHESQSKSSSPDVVGKKLRQVPSEKVMQDSIIHQMLRDKLHTTNNEISNDQEEGFSKPYEPTPSAKKSEVKKNIRVLPSNLNNNKQTLMLDEFPADLDFPIAEVTNEPDRRSEKKFNYQRHRMESDEVSGYKKSMDLSDDSLIKQLLKEKLPNDLNKEFRREPSRGRYSADGRVSGDDFLADVKPLNIFNPSKWVNSLPSETIPMPVKWLEEEKKIMEDRKFFPNNAFEEMIMWTREGVMWRYPVDNEQGMDEEKNTPFYEHVFLDKYLSPFPKEGPIRRFMELVVQGLSKNPYLTVAEKVDHINWYAEYFKKKQPFVTTEKLLAEEISA